MKAIAEFHRIPVTQPESVNTPVGVAQLQQMRPDLLVVAAYGQILSKDVLAVPPMGAINVHASLLPKYRGAAPVAHAILAGEAKTGVTIIRITLGLDAGDMLVQQTIDIGPDETAGDLEARLATLGAKLAVIAVEKLKAGPVPGTKQDPKLVTKAPKLTKEMGLIDWEKPADFICRQVRALQPWPTAYTFLHRAGKPPVRVIINKAAFDGSALWVGGPGRVWAGQPRLLVQTAAGFVDVLELQPAGKKRMTATEFLRGHPVAEGDHFGPDVPA
jgi:methionyl-tRNA formyltransferase